MDCQCAGNFLIFFSTTLKMVDIVHFWEKATTLKLHGMTKTDLENNQDAVRAAIAKALGIPVDEVNLNDVIVNPDGSLELKIVTPSSIIIPSNFADVVMAETSNITGLDNVNATTSNEHFIKPVFRVSPNIGFRSRT